MTRKNNLPHNIGRKVTVDRRIYIWTDINLCISRSTNDTLYYTRFQGHLEFMEIITANIRRRRKYNSAATETESRPICISRRTEFFAFGQSRKHGAIVR